MNADDMMMDDTLAEGKVNIPGPVWKTKKCTACNGKGVAKVKCYGCNGKGKFGK